MCAYALSLANDKSPGEADTFLTDKRAKNDEVAAPHRRATPR